MKNWLLLCALILAAFTAAQMPAWAQSNCATDNIGTDVDVHCGPGTVDSNVSTGSGNDTVTTTDADFDGNRIYTYNGNDSVDVGTSTVDLVNAGPGADTVTVESSNMRKVTGADDSDNITISDGSDIQIVGGDIDADTAANDTISVINSTVGTVGGDDPDNTGIGGGDDVITITGSSVDDVSAGAGNDDVTIKDGTTINNGLHGDDGNDTLRFAFTTSSKSEYNDFQQQLNVANPQNGSVTWRGVTYSFNTFEALQNLLKLLQVASGHGSSDSGGGSVPIITDGRLDTNPAAPAVTYCSGGEIQVYAADGSGLIVAAHALNLASGANASAANVVISYDAASGNVMVSVNGGAYVFTFPATLCAG